MSNKNRITDRGYTGTLVFYKHLKYGIYSTFDGTEEEFHNLYEYDDENIFLGSCNVDVKFDVDTREAEIAGLEKQRESIRAEMGRQIAHLEDRISNLRALPNREDV